MTSALADPLTGQLPLLVCVESDDVALAKLEDVAWFHYLRDLNWELFRAVACEYYQALWNFNQDQQQERSRRSLSAEQPNSETKPEATRRLLFERPTMVEGATILVAPKPVIQDLSAVDPTKIAPGHVPIRLAGRTPKCFFALLKSFLGLMFRGIAPEPEKAFYELIGNPSYARVCGFTLPDRDVGYRDSDVPSIRKLEQFDQIMRMNGLWDHATVTMVRENIRTGRIKPGSTLVHDTTHFPAYSGFQSVTISPGERPTCSNPASTSTEQATESSQDPVATSTPSESSAADDRGTSKAARKAEKERRKSQPKTTKNCRCPQRDTCPHEWVSADPGAGTVVKHGNTKHWAHKASTLAFANQEGILLDAAAMTDGASHDSRSLVPHLERLKARYPELFAPVTRVLDDAAADIPALKKQIKDEFAIELVTSSNPRGRKPITDDLPRGIDHITPKGTPVCLADLPFDFKGCRSESKQFLFQAPNDEAGNSVCAQCPFKAVCCNEGSERRHLAIDCDRLPWIDPDYPQLSQSFKREFATRTVIERLHKLMKFDFGSEDLAQRGSDAFQARLDKTLLAMHIALAAN